MSSQAARLNNAMILKLTKALEADPEVDLMSLFPPSYPKRLRDRKQHSQPEQKPTRQQAKKPDNTHIHGINCIALPSGNDEMAVIKSLATEVKQILGQDEDALPSGMISALQRSRVIWHNGEYNFVVDLGAGIAVKTITIDGGYDLTEYTALEFLVTHDPGFPAPRPLGVIRLGNRYFLFQTLMPGVPLSVVWDNLARDSKRVLSDSLEELLVQLRSIPRSAVNSLGGPFAEGCKDARRHARVCPRALQTAEEVVDWQYSAPRCSGPVFVKFLRGLTRSAARCEDCYFTHGDLRPENIMVEKGLDSAYRISGIIDWEYAGFYPAHYEAIKATNTLATTERNDWFLFLPPSMSPKTYLQPWLLDRLWDPYIV